LVELQPAGRLLLAPLVTAGRAAVKCRHWFVCASRLNLHKVRAIVFTLWTRCRRRIHIFPRFVASQNVIDFLSFQISPILLRLFNFNDVRARFAVKLIPSIAGRLLDEQQIGALRTKPHLIFLGCRPTGTQ